MNPLEREDVHHLDTNTLDNQRENLECIDHDNHKVLFWNEKKREAEDDIPF